MIYISKLKQRILGGHERTARAYRNVFFSFFIRGLSIISQFALVPLTLNYLDKYQYGIWLTLASVIGWISFFDVGIGNGLRNKLAEALASGNLYLARVYISTSYALVSVIFLSLLVLFWIVNPYLNWGHILNATPELNVEMEKMVLFVFAFFCLRFILMLISNILLAHQKTALSNLINPLGNIFSLIIIYILTRTTESSLFWVGFTFSAAPVVVLFFFNIIFFSNLYKPIAPGIRFINFRHSSDLLGLGVQFFIIQIASMIIFTSSNIIISQLFGPDQVTVYNVAFKYFAVSTMVYGIIIAPFWSAITEAFVKNEHQWIRNAVRKLEMISFGFVGLSILMVLFAKPAYELWLGDSVNIPVTMNIMMCLLAIISLLATPYNTFINGIGKVRLQLYSAVISIIITIPLAIIFAKTLQLGPSGVVLATLCTTFPTMILWKIQYTKILGGTASGIWNK